MSQRRYRHVPSVTIEPALRRGWFWTKQTYGQDAADYYDACCHANQPFVIVIQPRTAASVEWATDPMAWDDKASPKVAQTVLDDIRERATILQKNSRSRKQEIHFDTTATGGTIHGLREDDAKYLAHYIAQRLNDPATYFTGKITPLFTQEDDIA